MTFGCKIFVNYISFDIYLVEPTENVTNTLSLQLYFIFPPHTHSLSLSNYILSFHLTNTHSLSSLNSSIANFFSLFLFLIPVYTKPDLVHQPEKMNTKFGNSCVEFGAKGGLNFRALIQLSETLPVELTEFHS